MSQSRMRYTIGNSEQILVTMNDLGIVTRRNSQAFALGAKAFCTALPAGLILECTTAGITASSAPNFSNVSADSTVTDGTVVWTVKSFGIGGGGGSGNANIIELTQAEYDLLSTEEKQDENVMYVITDSLPSVQTKIIEVTKAQYDLLSAAEKNNPSYLYVVDNAEQSHEANLMESIMNAGKYERAVPITGDKTTLNIPAIAVNVGSAMYAKVAQVYDITLPGCWDDDQYTVASNRNGRDFYVYACAGNSLKYVLSANSTVPTGYTAESSRKIGGFHCECADIGTIANHPLSGYLAGDILPASVWDLKHRPIGEPEGFLYDEGQDLWVAAYGLTWTGSWGSATATMAGRALDDTLKLESKYLGEWADGTSSEIWHCMKFEQILSRQKQRLPYQREFVQFSLGSNQGTNIAGSADPIITGGHVDTAGRRMVSNIGCEDCCGDHQQWGADVGASTATNWSAAYDANDRYVAGQGLDAPVARPALGGYYTMGIQAGSRAVAWNSKTLDKNYNSGARAVSEPLFRKAI